MGDGPKGAKVFCVGEAPGREEDAGGRPFIGQAGKEFNENYLNLAGLYRDDVYVTNTVHCRPDLNRKPNPTEVRGCSSHFLPDELAEISPEVVVLMGATACSLVPDIDLESEHGIPRLGELFGWAGWILPMYHPASGLHETAMMIPMLSDWENLRAWLEHAEWVWPLDSTRKDYGLLESKREVEEFAHAYFLRRIKWQGANTPIFIGGDTESHDHEPYSWQVSLEDGIARMVMLKNKEACNALVDFLAPVPWLENVSYVFHYAPADLPIFEQQFGFSLDGKYRDTMLEGYGFGGQFGRLGLKALARRILGRQRLSWEETVTPWSKEVLTQWMMNGFVHAEQNWRTVERRYSKPKKNAALWSMEVPKELKSKIHRSEAEKLLVELQGYTINNPEYKIWEKIDERMPKEWLDKLIKACGPMPVKGIAHCPLDVQIEYACSDPDDTRQLAIRFETMRKEFIESLNVQDEDRDQIA